jgi:hypothetical protein
VSGFVIRAFDKKVSRWYGPGGTVDSECEARVFESREQAEKIRLLCGLYAWLGLQTAVEKTKFPVYRVPAPDEMIVSPRQLEAREQTAAPKKQKQLDLF